MKKVLVTTIFAVIMISSTVFYSSCNKEENESRNYGASSTGEALTPPTGWGINRVYDKAIYDCAAPPVNCFDDVIVRPTKYAELFNLISSSPVQVGSYFNGNSWHEFMPGLLEAQNLTALTTLQSGTVFLTEEVNVNTNLNYILVHDVNGEPGDDPIYVFEFSVED